MRYEPCIANIWTAPRWMVLGANLITRDGRVATITLVNPDCHYSTKPVAGIFRDGEPGTWMLNGSAWSSGQKDDWDIVGIAPETDNKQKEVSR